MRTRAFLAHLCDHHLFTLPCRASIIDEIELSVPLHALQGPWIRGDRNAVPYSAPHLHALTPTAGDSGRNYRQQWGGKHKEIKLAMANVQVSIEEHLAKQQQVQLALLALTFSTSTPAGNTRQLSIDLQQQSTHLCGLSQAGFYTGQPPHDRGDAEILQPAAIHLGARKSDGPEARSAGPGFAAACAGNCACWSSWIWHPYKTHLSTVLPLHSNEACSCSEAAS